MVKMSTVQEYTFYQLQMSSIRNVVKEYSSKMSTQLVDDEIVMILLQYYSAYAITAISGEETLSDVV